MTKEDVFKKMQEFNNVFDAIYWALEQRATLSMKPIKPNVTPKTADEARALAEKLKVYELAMEQYAADVEEYRRINGEIETVVARFIQSEAGFDNIPEQYKSKVWQRAWSDGHSAGYHDVYLKLCELVEIFE